ncbi:MAG TPA: STAS domain-containing protein [Allosphingosinicella sp.]|nr:STAS domain-containing protein [Allosphingosinicella sp.]
MTEFEDQDGIVVVRIGTERLDAAAAPAFKKALQENITDQPHLVILDVSSVQFLDSTGLGVFVSLLKMMGVPGVIGIVGAQAAVRRLLQITQLDRIFRLFDNISDATAALRSS